MLAFDGVTKLITVSAVDTVSVRDVYSRWADWVVVGDNAKYLPAFATLGGDDIDPSAGTTIPIYAFLLNGWRIRPREASHTLTVNDGILLVAGGGDPFVNTVGSFVVRINYQQPVQAISFASGGGGGVSASDIALAVWTRILEGSYTAEQMIRIMAAVLVGNATGINAPGPETFASIDGSKTRVAGTVGVDGVRTVTARDGTP